MIQPLLLRAAPHGGEFMVVSGHRRWLAARHLGWKSVPARILSVSSEEALRIRLVENLHHEPLGDLEVAEALERCLLVNGSSSLAEEGDILGVDEETIEHLRNLLKTSPRAREEFSHVSYGLGGGRGGPRETAEATFIRERGGVE